MRCQHAEHVCASLYAGVRAGVCAGVCGGSIEVRCLKTLLRLCQGAIKALLSLY